MDDAMILEITLHPKNSQKISLVTSRLTSESDVGLLRFVSLWMSKMKIRISSAFYTIIQTMERWAFMSGLTSHMDFGTVIPENTLNKSSMNFVRNSFGTSLSSKTGWMDNDKVAILDFSNWLMDFMWICYGMDD